MDCRAADGLARIILAHLDGIIAIDDALICPVEFRLLRFIGCKVLQRTPIGSSIERDHREASLSETAGKRATARARADNREIDRSEEHTSELQSLMRLS